MMKLYCGIDLHSNNSVNDVCLGRVTTCLARMLHENADNGVYFIKSVSESQV